MATTSATSSLIATLGVGSGIDFAGLAKDLAAAQFAGRIDRNSARTESVERQISAASALKSSLLQLAASIGDRVRSGDLSSQPLIANSSVAAVSRGTASGRGSYSLEVSQLAASQVLSSSSFASSTAQPGSGTLTFRFGTVSGGSFAEDTSRAAAIVSVPSGASLADVAGAINAARIGISAYVAMGTGGAHLVLKGKEGAANGFTVEAAETPGEEGLAALDWSPTGGSGQLQATARDAEFKLDGLAMARPSNAIPDLVPGLSLTLTATNPGAPTTIRFSDPGAAVSTFMNDLVGALNELAGELNKQVDARAGEMARDKGAQALRRALSQLAGTVIMPGAASGEPATLADLGLATNRDGTFRLDNARLTATQKASPEGIAAMFTTGIRGVYASFDSMARRLTSIADPGTLSGSLNRLNAQKLKLTNEASDLAEGQERLRARLSAQFSGTESRVGAARSTLSFLQNQIAAWNAQKG